MNIPTVPAKEIVVSTALKHAQIVSENNVVNTTNAARTDVEQRTLTPAELMPVARPRAFYIASLWHIESAPGVDMITATNNNTGDKYDGSIADFNLMLQGN